MFILFIFFFAFQFIYFIKFIKSNCKKYFDILISINFSTLISLILFYYYVMAKVRLICGNDNSWSNICSDSLNADFFAFLICFFICLIIFVVIIIFWIFNNRKCAFKINKKNIALPFFIIVLISIITFFSSYMYYNSKEIKLKQIEVKRVIEYVTSNYYINLSFDDLIYYQKEKYTKEFLSLNMSYTPYILVFTHNNEKILILDDMNNILLITNLNEINKYIK